MSAEIYTYFKHAPLGVGLPSPEHTCKQYPLGVGMSFLGPLKRCGGGAPLKAQVYSSYLWNVQSKPFGSGFFGTQLERALNLFPLRNTVHSHRFQKYLPLIAVEWGMPYTTEDEQRVIFEKICDLRSIRQRGDQSKLGRWVSWNTAAEKNLADFSAWKMILEDTVGGPMDLDNAADLRFDDLRAAARAETPLQALGKLREQGSYII